TKVKDLNPTLVLAEMHKIDDTIDVSKQEITEEQKETSEKPKVKDTIFAIKENDQMKLMKEEVGGSVQKTENEISVSEQFTLGLEEKKLKKPSLQGPRDLSPIPKELKQEESEKLKVLRPEESLRVIEASKENRKETVVQTLEEKEKVIDKKITHFCTNCGKPLVNTWKICSYCGIRIRKELWDVEGKPETEISTIKKLEEPEVSLSKEIGKAGFKEKALIKSKELIREKLVPEKVLEEQIIVEEIKPIEHKPVKLEPLKNFCPFCGVENSLEQKRCKQCGYKFKQ
ncbi:MAG: zinc ribbon domain-containing protein, partial [Candidatus Thorarchaeota archaeon]